MKKSIAMKWAADLESGLTGQTKGQLRSKDNNFCCLGRLCSLHAEAHPKFAAAQTKKLEYDGENEVPSELVADWAEMHDCKGMRENGFFKTSKGEFFSLAEANDGGVKFKEIATLIRLHYKEL